MGILLISHQYNEKPSRILGIENTYEAYCFDEACFLILSKLKENQVPVFPNKKKIEPGHGQFSNMYSQLGVTR